jgi:hypothetical protein
VSYREKRVKEDEENERKKGRLRDRLRKGDG